MLGFEHWALASKYVFSFQNTAGSGHVLSGYDLKSRGLQLHFVLCFSPKSCGGKKAFDFDAHVRLQLLDNLCPAISHQLHGNPGYCCHRPAVFQLA
jgi:hypothetical protein